MLTRSEADSATAFLSWTLERDDFIDFTVPLLRDEMTLIAPVELITNAKADVQLWVYVQIFPISAWILVALVVLVFTIGFLSLSGHIVEDPEEFTWLNGLAASGLLFIQQGYPLWTGFAIFWHVRGQP